MYLTERLLLAAVSAALALLAGEAVLRLACPAVRRPFLLMEVMESERGKFCVYDPMLGWTGKPGAMDDFNHLDCRHHVSQNKYGFRGSEYGPARTGRKRVVVLGDSFVWGFGVDDGDIFTSVVEREGRGSPEMVNLGVSGFGTDQEYLLWRSLGRSFRPDEVLLAVVPHNDTWENVSSEAYGYPKPVLSLSRNGVRGVLNRPVPRPVVAAGGDGVRSFTAGIAGERHPIARLAARSALVSAAAAALARYDGPREFMEERRILTPRRHMTILYPNVYLDPSSVPSDAANWEKFFGLIDAVREDVVKSGAEFRLLIVPSIVQVYPGSWEDFVRSVPLPFPAARWDPEAPNRLIASYCRERRIPFTDPLPVLKRAARKDPFLYFPLNNHWTAGAHRLVAGQLIEDMR